MDVGGSLNREILFSEEEQTMLNTIQSTSDFDKYSKHFYINRSLQFIHRIMYNESFSFYLGWVPN